MVLMHEIYKSFGTVNVLKGIDLTINKGEMVSIVGPSGAGKTTLLQIMGTLDKPDRGDVVINGRNVSSLNEKELAAFRNKHIGFVFQFHQHLLFLHHLRLLLCLCLLAHLLQLLDLLYLLLLLHLHIL